MNTAMAQGARARVRTPGKHIVMFSAAALAIIIGATSVLRDVDYAPALSFGGGGEAIESDLLALDPFLVDLAPDSNGRVAYLRLAMALKMSPRSDAAAQARLEGARAAIGERVTFLLRGLTPEDFAGEAGMERVKGEILRRVNIALAPERAEDVVISELVIQ